MYMRRIPNRTTDLFHQHFYTTSFRTSGDGIPSQYFMLDKFPKKKSPIDTSAKHDAELQKGNHS